MVSIDMAENRVAYLPRDWPILNIEEAACSTHACVLSTPNAGLADGSPFYVFFSNSDCNDFTETQKEEVYLLVEELWPQFLQFRLMEPEKLDPQSFAEISLAVSEQLLRNLGLNDFAEKAQKEARAVNGSDFMDYLNKENGLSRETMQQLLAHTVHTSKYKHALFEIYPDGKYPFGNEAPYGAVIKIKTQKGR